MSKVGAAVEETLEEINARLAEEAALSGERFEPTGDDAAEAPKADADAKSAEKPKDDIDPDVLAAIAGEDKPKMVPHARFNEVNEEAKAHRARVLELEEQLARVKGSAPAEQKKDEPKPEAFDFDAAEERYSEALLNGEKDNARQIRAEIRAKEQEAADRRAEDLADRRYKTNKAEDDAKRTKLEFDLELSKAYAAYPFLDSSSADKNDDAIEETLVWHKAFVDKGKTPSEALIAAVAKVGPRYKAVEPETIKPDAEVPKPDLNKALARADKIPAKAEGVGARAQSLNVAKMTTKDIKALSSEDEARLAGDVV
jgi:hypothetical protein